MLFSKLGQLHIRSFVGSDRLVGFRDMRLIFLYRAAANVLFT